MACTQLTLPQVSDVFNDSQDNRHADSIGVLNLLMLCIVLNFLFLISLSFYSGSTCVFIVLGVLEENNKLVSRCGKKCRTLQGPNSSQNTILMTDTE